MNKTLMCLLMLTVNALASELWVDSTVLSRSKRETTGSNPHGEFCVDVSTYTDVSYKGQSRNQCNTEFNKDCKVKSQEVCDEVTEIQCEIVPYTDCRMNMEATPYNSYEMVPKTFLTKVCSEGMDTVQHTKMFPECRNITKQNCITKWETDENGNQIWAGNEDCEPVTWRECKLVPRQVDFKVPKIDCKDGERIPYMDSAPKEKTQMTTSMTCKVLHTTSCKPITSTKCERIKYQECQEEPTEKCNTVEIQMPVQKKEHKKKCLLANDGSVGIADRNPRRLQVPKQKQPQVSDNKKIIPPFTSLPLSNFGSAGTQQANRFNKYTNGNGRAQPIRNQKAPPARFVARN